ncbi:unnamed protein product, partial [Porites lobata]
VLLYLIIINVLSLPLTSVLNGLVIFAVKNKPRLKTTSNVALACLATTDCVMGVIGQPFFAVQLAVLLQGEGSSSYCTLLATSVNVVRVLGVASFLHITVMNIERYIAIKHSLKYKTLVTRGRLLRGSAFAKAYTVLLCLIILNFLSLPLTSVLNGLVIITVKTKPRLKTTSNVALACLATTDCVMGVIGQPFFAVQLAVLLQGESSSSYCTLLAASVNVIRVLGAATFLHLTVINIERYIAIKHSLKYKILVTRGRLFRGSAFVWVVSFLLTVPLSFVDNEIYLVVNNMTGCVWVAIVTFWSLNESTRKAYTVLLCLIILNFLSLPLTSVLNGLVIITVKTKPRLKTTSN